ncbi:MAG: carbon storage regulator [Deltaproteobacteria bacterium]|nr:carbon storage regulator [Deltaproteobacteria bacterium]
MLVLTRKVGEKVLIGDGVWVIVNKISRNKISLGFEAPPGILIRRGEIVAKGSPNRNRKGQ